MVQSTSSMFPLIDRNPQLCKKFQRQAWEFIKATHKVYTARNHPSFLKVRVMRIIKGFFLDRLLKTYEVLKLRTSDFFFMDQCQIYKKD